mmetsp:Transcript_34228/g.110336  ORF Transcript_34228/g.110336 Transcript_34228/m.110336 type:complete len:215 (-) Transcript_34228:285-929(-)
MAAVRHAPGLLPGQGPEWTAGACGPAQRDEGAGGRRVPRKQGAPCWRRPLRPPPSGRSQADVKHAVAALPGHGPHPGERGAERAERERAHGGRPRHDRQQQRRHLRAWRLRGRGLPLRGRRQPLLRVLGAAAAAVHVQGRQAPSFLGARQGGDGDADAAAARRAGSPPLHRQRRASQERERLAPCPPARAADGDDGGGGGWPDGAGRLHGERGL